MAVRFESLDTLRYLFAAIVVLGHVVGWRETFLGGGLAVDFFFVLSGFVLAHGFINKGSVSFGDFVSLRLGRMYPLYILSLVITIPLWHYINDRSLNYYDLIKNVFLLQNIIPGSGNGYNYPSWSISAELWVNIALLYFLFKKNSAPIAIILCFASILVWFSSAENISHAHSEEVFLTTVGFFRCVAGISAGVVTYKAFAYVNTRRCDNQEKSYLRQSVWTLLEFLAITAVILCIYVQRLQLHYVAVLIMPIVIFIFALNGGWLSSLLSWRGVARIGAYSYGVYLLHVPVLFSFRAVGIMEHRGNDLLDGFTVLLVATLLSIPVYHWLERPALRMVKGFVVKV